MSKNRGQTVTQQVDPQTQAYVNQLRQYALGATGLGGNQGDPNAGVGHPFAMPYGGGLAGFQMWDAQNRQTQQPGAPPQPFAMPGLPPELQAAQQQYGQYAQAGNLGLTALTGGANPFMNQYLGQLNPVFDQLRQQAVSDADARATQMGAFGGSRGDIYAAQAAGDVNRQQAGLNYQAFNDAQQRALAAANLGFGAQAQSAFLPQQYYGGQLGLLNQAIGPYGQSQTTPMYRNLGAGILGGAAQGAAFGPFGALAGGILGAL